MIVGFSNRKKIIALLLSICSTLFIIVYAYKLLSIYEDTNMQIESTSNKINIKVVKRIDNILNMTQELTLRLNHDLQKVPLKKTEVWSKLQDLIIISDGVSGIGVNFFPYVINESIRLFSPYVYRTHNSYERDNVDEYYDYSIYENNENVGKRATHTIAQWLSPSYDTIAKCMAIQYEVPIIIKDKQYGIGYSNYCIKNIVNEINQNYLGNDSYFILLDSRKKILYNSLVSYSNDKLQEIIKDIELVPGKVGSDQKEVNGNVSWVHSRKLESTNWYVVTIINKDIHQRLIEKIQGKSIWGSINQYLPLSSLLVFTSIFWIIYVLSTYSDLRATLLWTSSFLVSAIFMMGTLYIWNQFYSTYTDEEFVQNKVYNKASIRKVKLDYNTLSMNLHRAPPIFVPTSLFIQSMEFVTAYNIKITGYIWQKYPINSVVSSDDINYGVVFPEAESISIEKSFEHKDNNFLTIGWAFEGVFREKFNYDHYPFDQQLVWIRIWHTDFGRNIVLIPMIESYENINPSALPGLEKEFVINGWSIERTFYDFRTNQYNTNFGIPSQFSKDRRPEIYFNVSLRRNFIDPFISYLFPVLVVLLMLFGVLITTSSNTDKPEQLGFSASSVLSSSSALFFVSLISHVQLRNHVGTSRMVYLEYFFLVSYVMILMVVLNAVLFSLPIKVKVIDYRDNLIPKTLYWPILTGFIFFTTLIIYSWQPV